MFVNGLNRSEMLKKKSALIKASSIAGSTGFSHCAKTVPVTATFRGFWSRKEL